jgi:hypothetical protein
MQSATDTLDDGSIGPLRPLTDPKEIIRINDLKLDVNEAAKNLRYGRNALGVLAGLTLAVGLGQYYFGSMEQEQIDVLAGTIVMAVLYGGGFLLGLRYPLAGVTFGLTVYLVDQLSVVFIDPSLLFQGIILKIAIIAILGNAVVAGFRLRKRLTTLSQYPVPVEQIERARRLRQIPRTPQVNKVPPV